MRIQGDESRSWSWAWAWPWLRSWSWPWAGRAALEVEPIGDMAGVLAEMQAMRAEMNAIRQAQVEAAAAPIGGNAPLGGNVNGGEGLVQPGVVPNYPMDLREWCEDFRSIVERALGVEVQDDYTDELRGGDHSHGQRDQKGQPGGGPAQKKDKNHHHHPYGGSSSQSRRTSRGGSSGGGSTQFRCVAKPGLGLVCFRCGDAHRRADCRWTVHHSSSVAALVCATITAVLACNTGTTVFAYTFVAAVLTTFYDDFGTWFFTCTYA
ncbi:hypothetical protein PR202_gn00677 [Eleusine coracana subsp. coracana]|uniref:Uncharacterized protein n=1 Tax=Eleusine coracana subsp. coracana TaxID=191504 RepID=A0AAV5G2K5_ELECO|nr:hypothetical protein PR202_gn00677 [Eleusine coracana subsp. coracana]